MNSDIKYLNLAVILVLFTICGVLLFDLMANDRISLTQGEYKDYK